MRRPGLWLVAVEALLVLVLLPVTVNVATGGSAPPGFGALRPHAWLAVAALACIAVGLPVWQYLGEGRVLGGARYSKYHRETQRARVLQLLRERVDAGLAGALADVPWIPPRLALRAEAVRPSADLLPAVPDDRVPADVRDAFERFDRNLLILGGPGAGKSTLLLELARRLLAEDGVPVLLGLGRWTAVAEEGRPRWWRRRRRAGREYFARWCVAEMVRYNGIPRPLAAQWLQDDEVVLLFDGLDEMPAGPRVGFVKALEELQQERGPLAMAMTCRTGEYAGMAPLGVQGAVEIEPLDRSDVDGLLAGDDAAGLDELRRAWRADEGLRELVDSPLLLALLAAQLRGGEHDVAAEGGRSRLLERYLTVALASRAYPPQRPAPTLRLRRWLGTVAEASTPFGRQWSAALRADVSHAFVTGFLPALAAGAAAVLVAAPVPRFGLTQVAAVVVLVAAFGLPAGWTVFASLTRRRLSPVGVTMGLATGLACGAAAAGAIAGVLAAGLSDEVLGVGVCVLIVVGAYSLVYHAYLADQRTHPEATAEVNARYRRASSSRRQVRADPEVRAEINATTPAVLLAGLALAGPLIMHRTVGIALAEAVGLLLGAAVTAARGLAGLPGEHPAARAVRLVHPRLILGFVVLLIAGICGDMISNDTLSDWLLPHLQSLAGSRPWVLELPAVLFGFIGGQVAAHRVLRWKRFSSPFAAAVARLLLATEGRLPWRVRRYLTYVAGTGIMRRDGDRFVFRHELLAEHCRRTESGGARG
ncbi:NACHT domain-containing protein [Dactylosporangium darangshiense]